MKINSYSFGNIKVNGQNISSDLIIFKDKIINDWWRKEGHRLHKEDLKEVIIYDPDVLIIGTGKQGIMTVPQSLINFLEDKNITVKVNKTDKAVQLFNKARGKKVAALHLTC